MQWADENLTRMYRIERLLKKSVLLKGADLSVP